MHARWRVTWSAVLLLLALLLCVAWDVDDVGTFAASPLRGAGKLVVAAEPPQQTLEQRAVEELQPCGGQVQGYDRVEVAEALRQEGAEQSWTIMIMTYKRVERTLALLQRIGSMRAAPQYRVVVAQSVDTTDDDSMAAARTVSAG